jgi:peptidoglycan/xylan/chitin deacetylase (PgdA/CDA1 family)
MRRIAGNPPGRRPAAAAFERGRKPPGVRAPRISVGGGAALHARRLKGSALPLCSEIMIRPDRVLPSIRMGMKKASVSGQEVRSPHRFVRRKTDPFHVPGRDEKRPGNPVGIWAAAWLAVLCAACIPQSSGFRTRTDVPTDPASIPSSTSAATPTPTRTPVFTHTLTPSSTSTPTPELFAEEIPVLEYHFTTFKLGDVMMTTEWFLSQMRTLADGGYTTITAEQLAAFLDGKNIPAKSVVLTFDAGTAHRDDFADNIIPALEKYRFHALFFVLTSNINDACGMDNKICWGELRKWADGGLISVESHGVYHPDYATISAEEQRWDALVSRRIITDKAGRAPVGFAYPYDSYNDSAGRVLKSVGYAFALAGNTRNDRGVHLGDADRYHLPRVYPYSNPQIYPVIYGTFGLTFDQMVAKYSESQSVVGTPP